MPDKIITTCPQCNYQAIALKTDDTSVLWCECGHVIVVEAGSTKLVYDFSLKGLNE